ncbi:hypothetical protein JHK85_029469 [Glycine max]|nr:hypothetical protein JHK85_029469 [Glycine max]
MMKFFTSDKIKNMRFFFFFLSPPSFSHWSPITLLSLTPPTPSPPQHFLLGSLRQRIIAAISDVGVVETFISDTDLPANVAFLGLVVDSPCNRLLAEDGVAVGEEDQVV